MVDFKQLKSQSKDFESLYKQLEESSGKKDYSDNRFWEPTKDKTGTAHAILRWMPTPEGEKQPWTRLFTHSFKGPGGWYIENCPTTLQHDCPLCAANSLLWETNLESNQSIAKQRKRKLNFIGNVEVVQDPARPEFNGGVYLYKYGVKIMAKNTELAKPTFPGRLPVNPFDLWNSPLFLLTVVTIKEGNNSYPNYDQSSFDMTTIGPARKTDKEIEALYKKMYPLSEFAAESAFKSYAALETRLNKVLGGVGNAPLPQPYPPTQANKESTFQLPNKQPTVDAPSMPESDDESEEELMKYFEQAK